MGLQKLITTYIPQGVFVITSKWNDKINGMTAAWVSQVSFKPRLLSVAIAPQRYTYELIKQSGIFCINVLSKNQIELAKHFGFKSGKKVNKFENISYKTAFNGSPVLLDAIAYFECRVMDEFKAGDHMIIVGEIVDYQVLKEGEEPLIFKWDDFFSGVED
ncbi:flavin reductase family protein [Thermodesulfobacterium hydrogeniphilum]|uniref:flavin reductase family protein n=1 Tax=Thermodesulfobacterium hydrogeniphilum TaxID=161156 RepID=UPI00068FBD03|nr:flavin reductase family protein [Thermodesulfobacterium hydrogeniphilum]